MTTESGKSRSVIAIAILAVAFVWNTHAAAEEPTEGEEPPAEEAEATEAAAEDTDLRTSAEAKGLVITAPGGVPLEAAPADTAIESVKESMARITEQAATGVPESYIIEFGDTFDWVRLVSGEWLKGEIKRMRDDNLEFDSDKLDLQNIDFGDVTEVHSPQVNTYVFDDRISAIGVGVITADKVIVETEEGTKTFDRSELESIVSGGEREKDWWSMKLGFGLTLNRGNTDQLTYDLNFNTRREDNLTLLDLNYTASFGRTSGTQKREPSPRRGGLQGLPVESLVRGSTLWSALQRSVPEHQVSCHASIGRRHSHHRQAEGEVGFFRLVLVIST